MSPEDPLPDQTQIEVSVHAAFEEDDVALLNGLRAASPCNASWEEREGDDLVRFCARCQRTVYNVSGMIRREAADFVREADRRLGVRFYRRRDGTLLSDNCPVGGGRRAAGCWRGWHWSLCSHSSPLGFWFTASWGCARHFAGGRWRWTSDKPSSSGTLIRWRPSFAPVPTQCRRHG
jgi:hypothetical protein